MLPFDRSRLTVTNASGMHGDTMAEYVMATVVHMTWDFPRLLRQQQEHRWMKYEVPSLAGLTIGIIGAGRVGRRIGARARAFGMRVIGTRRSGGVVEGFDETRGPEGLCSVLGESDVAVVTLPLTEETRGVLGSRELRSIKPGAWLVNVSRGGIVREEFAGWPDAVARLFLKNLDRWTRRMRLLNVVDPALGY
jgi:phosphoglycerate dehydrogenase-like enzyme